MNRTLQEQFDDTEALRVSLKMRLETEALTDAQWSSLSNYFTGCCIRCNRLSKELRHEASKAAYAKAVSA